MITNQTATLTLSFEDGHQQQIRVAKAIELDVGPKRKQSIEFREVKDGSWIMSFTKPVFGGRKLDKIELTKN